MIMAATTIKFASEVELSEVLNRPLIGVSISEDVHGKCEVLTFWHGAHDGTSVFSQMHDVAEKLEVGFLNFKHVCAADVNTRSIRFESGLEPVFAQCLTIREREVTIESGLRMGFSNQTQLIVVPADFPCFLSVTGDLISSNLTRSEYPLDQYSSVGLFGAAVHQGN
jgi:hypothetical protein